ncbi:oxidoreductase [Arthrobacter sp. RIT-PI-e]|nr:oxidoreductase [Arthrobacter sp. RIT-PI-e]
MAPHRNTPSRDAPVPRIALVGVHGFGAHHLANIRRLEQAGTVVLVAVADPNPPEPGSLGADVEIFRTLPELATAGVRADVVIIATPIQFHAVLAEAALSLGADIYLEKPPVASLEQFHELVQHSTTAAAAVQTGFQSLGSAALPRIEELVASGEIGAVQGFSAEGAWVRTRGYFGRSRWAGKRTLDGVDVVDGVATNPLAHAIATALRVAGARGAEDVTSVETDLYRAHDIESDDTPALRIRTASGHVLTCALTLCAPDQRRPSVRVSGTLGEIVLYYTEDELAVTTPEGTRTEHVERVDLLENLLEHRSSGAPLLSSLEDSGAFMTVLEAIRTADAPRTIPDEFVAWHGEGAEAHPVVHGIEDLMGRALESQALFRELDPGWIPQATGPDDLVLDGSTIAQYRDGSGIAPTLAPRPYLHPVRTLGGVTVTDHLPLDHVWHLGAGVAVQDVDGVNCWGGRTYTRDAGAYVWRADHGRIERVSTHRSASSLEEDLRWQGPDGAALLEEQRRWAWRRLDDSTWQLTLTFTFRAPGDTPVQLGSPGSNGRPLGGYGGFFWRLPRAGGVDVFTAEHEGEDAVHGTAAPWLAWSADFDGGPATLVFLAAPEAPDPWFVRAEGYPGVGLSLAWDTPLTVQPGAPVTRTVRVLVADGRLDAARVRGLAGSSAAAAGGTDVQEDVRCATVS